MIKFENIKNLPQGPGVYIFKDRNNKPIYIGKAKNLKKRLSQYFQNKSLKVKKILEAAEKIEFIETKSEVEAIFKESDLIKKLNPYFNQLLRDDSKYFYLIFTNETFPKVLITHQPEKFSTKEIIGPFVEGTAIKKILNIIRKDIPFCTCKEKHWRICLNANLGLCFGWCCSKNSSPDRSKIKIYNQNINLIKKIFSQDLTLIKKVILNKIKKLLNENKLLEAEKLKNAYLALKKIESNQELIKEKDNLFIEHQNKKILEEIKKNLNLKKYPHLIEVIDISHFSGQEKVGAIVTFVDGLYTPRLSKKFKIKTILKPDDPRMIYEVLKRRLNHQEWDLPDLILVDGGKIQLKFAQKAVKEKNLDIKVIALAKPKEELFYDLNKKIDLKLKPFLRDFIILLDKKAHQFVIKYHRRRRDNLKNLINNA
jgi:excinuclease ABC subunit C